MTAAAAAYAVIFELVGDECLDAEPWKVHGPDGEFETCRDTEAEAVEFAAECNEGLAEEADRAEEMERENLIDDLIQGDAHELDELEDMTTAELRPLAAEMAA